MIFTTTINGKPINIEAETKEKAEQAAFIYKQLVEITGGTDGNKEEEAV